MKSIPPDANKFNEDLNSAIDNFMDTPFNKVITISHNDADGIASLHIIVNLINKINLDNDYFIYNRSNTWNDYLKGILPKNTNPKTAILFTDVGSNLSELLNIIKQREEHFFILDHHELNVNINEVEVPENLHLVNPTIYGFDGIDHISASTLAFMFSKKIKPSIIKQGWLTILGTAGDSLKSMDKLESFNRDIYQELVEEEILENKSGLVFFGSMHESIKNCIKNSILPFLRGIGGEPDQKVKLFLRKLHIDPNKKTIDLEPEEEQKIQEALDINCLGDYALLPQKDGMLKYAFEHALLLNILCFKNINAALSIIQRKTITLDAKRIYYEYIGNMVKNLKTLIKLPRIETKKAIFIAAEGKIPPSNWSDTASFSTVNNLLNPDKVLFFRGKKMKNMIKLSVRCTRQYLEQHQDYGVNKIIDKIKSEMGGTGGGHKLAGGLRLSIPSYRRLKEKIDSFI